MKNYYDELEINKNASQEVIEKVYKVLAKKYHPDMNQDENKEIAEEKFKRISEAYETLSDEEKRKKYDLELEQSNPTISYKDYQTVLNERNFLNNELNKIKNELYKYKNPYSNQTYYNRDTRSQYQQMNSNFNSNQYQNTSKNYSNINSNGNYHQNNNYTNTKKPNSLLQNLIYKIKQLFLNIGLLIFSIIIALLIINAFSFLKLLF